MANIKRKNDDSNLPARRRESWDPFRAFDEVFETMRPLAPWLERSLALPQGVLSPAFEVRERDDAYVIEADVPGMRDDDIDVQVTGNRVTISGRREERREQGDKDQYFTYERHYGSFTRSFTLPEGVDTEHIDADLDSGVLSVIIPKAEQAKPRKISLKERLKQKTRS